MSGEEHMKWSRFQTLMAWIGGLFLILVLLAALLPIVIESRKDGDRAEAIQNAKTLGYALSVFEKEYGMYPNVQTARTSSTGRATFCL